MAALGIVPRPMVFRDRQIQVATLTQFMVDPKHRHGLAAIKLLGTCFRGPQDMTWVDGASDPVYLLHRPFGSVPAPFYALHWTRVLQPFAMARDVLGRSGWANKPLLAAAGVATGVADRIVTRARPLRPPGTTYSARPASTEEVLDCIEEIGWREPLKPDYDRASFTWLISQVSRVSNRTLRMLVVTDSDGVTCGWLIYFVQPRGAAYLLQLGRRRTEDFEPIFHILLSDAKQLGCAMVKGTTRPDQLTTLTRNFCFFRHPETYALVHSRDRELLNVVCLGDAALTGLDGERWQRFAMEPWDR